MKIFAPLILLLGTLAAGDSFGLVGQADGQRWEIVSLVSRLSRESVGMECDVLGHICPQGDVATRLVKIGKRATQELLKVLEDENKGVAAHVLLTLMWEPASAGGRMRFGENYEYIFTYNGLEWAEVSKRNGRAYQVKKDALARNAQEWRRKIAEYKLAEAGRVKTVH